MKSIPRYDFHLTKYGEELLIDVVRLQDIKKYVTKHPVHTLSYYDITFITEGTGFFAVDDKRYTVSPGDVIFSLPGEVRTWDKDQILNGYALIFEEEFLLSFFNDPLFLHSLAYFHPQRTCACIRPAAVQPRIDQLIQYLIAEINDCLPMDKHILRAMLYEMLMLLNREYVKEANESCHRPETPPDSQEDALMSIRIKRKSRYVPLFIELVNTHFAQHHSVQYYADRLFITPDYLNQLSKRELGTPAKAYIRNRVLREAKKLLTYTHISVDMITTDLGFESTPYFVYMFCQHVGSTPLQYRHSTR